jgi:hypothetical protein
MHTFLTIFPLFKLGILPSSISHVDPQQFEPQLPSLPLASQAVAYHWYRGNVPITIYHHPGFYVLRPHCDLNNSEVTQTLDEFVDLGEHQGRHIYRTHDGAERSLLLGSCLSPLYSSGKDCSDSPLCLQHPGCAVSFKQPISIESAKQWFEQQYGQPVCQLNPIPYNASGKARAYSFEDVDGIEAIQFANRIVEQDQQSRCRQIKFAQPNWI